MGGLEAGVLYGEVLTFLGECFWVIEDIFEFVGHVEDFVQKEVGEV